MDDQRFASALTSVVDNYRIGLPIDSQTSAPLQALEWIGSRPKIALIVDKFSDAELKSGQRFTGPQGELARALIERGLKLPLDTIIYMSAQRFVEASKVRSESDLRILALGVTSFEALTRKPLESSTQWQGASFMFEGCRALATVSLEDVCLKPELKRTLWQDVQKLL